MKRFILAAMIFLFFCPTVWGLEVVDSTMTTAVEDRTPVDHVEVFPAVDGQLYCFTRLVGAEEPTEIEHLWYRDNQLMSRVILPVRSPDWRTWSTKKFLPEWAGKWRVEIRGASGSLLETLEFTLI